MGVMWRSIKVGNSKDNGHVERHVGSFQTMVCKEEYGYIGEGIRSSRKNSRPSPEIMDEIRKRINIRNRSELLTLLESLVEKYNSTSIENNLSAFQAHDLSKKINVINLPKHEFARLFWKEKINTVANSTIIKTIKGIDYHYIIWNTDLSLKINGQEVLTRYDINESDLIFLYDPISNTFLGSAEHFKKIHVATVNMTDEDYVRRQEFVNKKKAFISETTSKSEKEIQIEKDLEKYDYAILNPSTTAKHILDRAERELTLSTYRLDDFETKKGRQTHKSHTVNEEDYDDDRLLIISENIYQRKGDLKLIE